MATYTDTNGSIINVLTKAQYDSITKNDNELYLVTDENNLLSPATTFSLGAVKIGSGLNIDSTGLLSIQSSLDVNISGHAASATIADSATKLATAKTISLTGDVSGSGSFDGSNNLSITATVADDSHNHIISNVDNLQNSLDNKTGGSNYITITVNGDANTYYPVVLNNVSGKYPMQFVNISRSYSETAPDSWNTATHRGGLSLTLFWNGSRYWDGNGAGSTCYCVYKYESYSTMVGGIGNSTSGIVVWLRGGTATYHIHSLHGKAMSATVYHTTYTDSASRSFAPTTTISNISIRWPGAWMQGDSVTGAVWNDYAECRESDTIEPGYVLVETGDDTLTKSIKRMSPFAGVSSDTWGFSQGETENAKTPIAVAGRVLVYTYQDRNKYQPGDCVCAAPGGTVDIMTREEVIQYPDRVVGTVSCVPNYEEWGGGDGADRDPVKVNNRIWIKVR